MKSVLFTTFIYLSIGYLPQTEIIGLWNFAESLNGDYWSECKWNFTQLNNTDPGYFIPTTHFTICGLSITNNTQPGSPNNLQTVSMINFNFSNHLNGTISDAITSLENLISFELRHNDLLVGSIPSAICGLTQLESLIFHDLSISGYIPVCIRHLLSLKALWFQECNGINDTFPEWICELHQLQIFEFDTLHLTGTIPACIGNELTQLIHFAFYGIPELTGTLPHTIAHLTQLTFFELEYLPQLKGSIEESLFIHNPNLRTYYIVDNPRMNISIPATICNATKLTQIGMDHINTKSHIPPCIGQLSYLQQLQISGWSVSGVIPPSVCTLRSLWHLEISLTSISGTVPPCLSNMTHLKFIDLHSNRLHGRFPEIYAPNMTLIDIHDNAFDGSISQILTMPCYPHMEIVALHQNKLYDDDVTSSLQKLFEHSPRLKALSLYKNEYIHGYIPDFQNEISLELFQVFAAHNLDIYGTLPTHLHLGKNISNATASAWILHNNRLSSSVPSHLQQQQSFTNFSCVIILGNLLNIKDKNEPKWLAASSLFVSATNLYIDAWSVIKSKLIAIFSLTVLSFVIIHHLFGKHINNSDSHTLFFIQDIDSIVNKLSDSKLLIMICCLLLFYPFCNKYYVSSPFLAHFCLYFYYLEDEYVDTMLCIMILLFNITIASLLSKFVYAHEWKDEVNLNFLQQQNDADHAHDGGQTCLLWAKLLFYFTVYLVCISLTIIYILTESLPQDNVFEFSPNTQKAITGSVSLVLAFMNAIITPRFISSLGDIFECTLIHRTKIILALRTLNTIIIPILFIVYYSNECGSNWSTFWNPCIKNKNVFDVNVHVHTESFYINFNCSSTGMNCKIHYKGFGFDFNVLSHSDVCDPIQARNINMDKCLRHYFYGWTQVILNKMIIMIFMPFLIVLYKTISRKIKNCYYDINDRISICIDSEYTMIVSKIEIILAFSTFCPLLIPVTIMAIFACKYFYEWTINVLKWKLTFSNYSNLNQYPFGFLWFGFIFQQISIILFFTYSIQSVILTVFIVTGFIIIDLYMFVNLFT